MMLIMHSGRLLSPDVDWKSDTATHTESRRFLQHSEDDFLARVVGDSREVTAGRGSYEASLAGEMKVGGSLGCT